MKPRMLALFLLASINVQGGSHPIEFERQSARTDGTQKQPTPGQSAKPNQIFSKIVPLLLQKTSVPLRLPEYVPYSDDKETTLYGILKSAKPERYSIELAWLPDCDGGNACHVGYIGASKTAFPSEHKRQVLVSLKRGISGRFTGFDCDAHCDDASLDWKEGGYYYGISLKAGDKETLIRMANSAIP